MPRRSGKKKPSYKPSRNVAPAVKQDSDTPSPQEVIRELMTNKPGAVGFLLSLLQLAGHTTWIALVWYLSVSGKAEKLDSSSPLSWLVVGILGLSLLLTAVALFVCLYYGLRRTPRLLAIIGFCLSFFVGVMASAVVFMQGLRAMAG
ncbi:MAG: hypothetical protein U0936_15240 [Planctomycetaceae bacterium]